MGIWSGPSNKIKLPLQLSHDLVSPYPRAQRSKIDQMILPSFLTLNADHRSIGGFHVGFSIHGYFQGKASRPVVSNDLNAGDGLTAGPLSDSLKALFPQSRVVEADCTVMKYHHAGIRIWRPLATRRKCLKSPTAPFTKPVKIQLAGARQLIPTPE
jgi:hypothetical protein